MIKVMDKGTHSLDKRLQAMQELDKAGYEIHVNFSPIIVYDNWLEEYKELFQKVKALGLNNLECECIFLTHNAQKHLYNAEHYSEAEEYLWTPDNQESKTSLYGGDNIRYNWQLKNNYVSQFKKVLNEELPDMKVRYIF
jgi:DNA repair photolyase